jgi:hypothetical protein
MSTLKAEWYIPAVSYTSHDVHRSFLDLPNTALELFNDSALLANLIYTIQTRPNSDLLSAIFSDFNGLLSEF